MRSFPELFPGEASFDKLSALENFVIFSGKPDWLRPFLLMCRSCILHFYLRIRVAFRDNLKSSRSEVSCFETFHNFSKTIRGGVFTAQKMKFSIKDFFSKCDLVIFTEEILNGKYFLAVVFVR